MTGVRDTKAVAIPPPVKAQVAFAPVAFAVTEGPGHRLRYANAAFRDLQGSGDVGIGRAMFDAPPGVDLTPLLERALFTADVVYDELHAPGERTAPRWNCTVWPVSADDSSPEGLVIEIRDVAYLDGPLARQRALAERLLLGAMREQDRALLEKATARDAVEVSRRAGLLAAASRELATSLDEAATRDTVSRRVLPGNDTWCIVDLVEPDGHIQRLAVVHPNPAKNRLARTLVGRWSANTADPLAGQSGMFAGGTGARVIAHDNGELLLTILRSPENVATLRSIGFGDLLVVPLVVRGALLGAITFIAPADAPALSADDMTFASDLADRCAMALDNARLYREADALRVAADEGSNAKSAFLGNMGHELMTPLNAIGGYAELMEMGLRGPVTPEQLTDLSRIKQNQRHLLTLIAGILNFVRSEDGRVKYHFTAVPVQALLNDVAEMLDGVVKTRGLTLDRGECHGDATVWADADRVRQILLNLVMNAVKYTPEGGGGIALGCTVLRETVIIQVSDTGAGIPADKLGAIFDPFVQLNKGLTDRLGGVGLGLSISRDLARAMRGDLTVESTVGAGSRFTLTLRRAREDGATM